MADLKRSAKKKMRVLILSVLVLIVALVFGVFGHHMVTTGRPAAAVIGTGSGAAICFAIFVAVISASKKEPRLWPRVSASVFHFFVAYAFLDALRSLDFPSTYKVVSASLGAGFALCGLIVLIARAKKEPNQSPQPTRFARG